MEGPFGRRRPSARGNGPGRHRRRDALVGASLVLVAAAIGGCGGKGDDGQKGQRAEAPTTADGQDGTSDGAADHGLSPEEAATVVARVGDHEITVGELADRILAQSPYLRARYAAPERRREILDELIDFHLLAEEARRRGLDELPEVEGTRKQRMVEEMLSDVLRERRADIAVTEAEVAAYYDAHQDDWSQPEQVRASHIQVASEEAAEKILAELAEAPGDASRWRALARAHNEDPETRSTFGDLRFFSRPDEPEGPHVPTPIARAAFALEEVGAVHPEPVRTPAGWHVVRLTDRRAALRRSVDEVRRAIESRLWRDKQDAAVDGFVEELAKDIPYEIHRERIDDIQVGAPKEGDR